MRVEIDLYHAEDMDAFAIFLKTTAETQRRVMQGALTPLSQTIQKVSEASDEAVHAKIDEQPAQEQPAPKRRGRPKNPAKTSPDMIVDEPSQISTGEARTGPEDDPAKIQAQDEADEQAESAATKPAALTHNDLKTAMSGYVKKYGMDAAQADGPLIFKEVLGAPPEGKDYWQLSIVPEDRLQEALAGWNQAAIKNPFDRAAV